MCDSKPVRTRVRPLRSWRMDAPGAPPASLLPGHWDLAQWDWDPHTLVRASGHSLAAGRFRRCVDARARLVIAVTQVADLASGAFASESAGDAPSPSPPLPAAAAHRTSPPALLLCQVPSCGLNLEGMRSYNKRSRCAAPRSARWWQRVGTP